MNLMPFTVVFAVALAVAASGCTIPGEVDTNSGSMLFNCENKIELDFTKQSNMLDAAECRANAEYYYPEMNIGECYLYRVDYNSVTTVMSYKCVCEVCEDVINA